MKDESGCPTRESQVQQELAALERVIGDLKTRPELLGGRLMRILRIEPPSALAKPPLEDSGLAPLAASLQAFAMDLRVVDDALVSLISRCEV